MRRLAPTAGRAGVHLVSRLIETRLAELCTATPSTLHPISSHARVRPQDIAPHAKATKPPQHRAAARDEPVDAGSPLPPHLRQLLAKTGPLDPATLPPHLRALLDHAHQSDGETALRAATSTWDATPGQDS